MDWSAFRVSIALGLWTLLLLVPPSLLLSRWLAWRRFPGRALVEAAVAVPLVLPPTVLGFYLLEGVGADTTLGRAYRAVTGGELVFSFEGLVLASVLFNLPFAVQPMQRAFEAVPRGVREAAVTCGLSAWRAFWRVELPLAWPGLLSAVVLVFAHTLGEFGVVLMVGGNIPGETRTLSIAIYDRVQAFDEPAAARMSLFLLVVSVAAIAATVRLGRGAWRDVSRRARRGGS